MKQKTFRLAAAATTFALGLAAVWLSGALAPLQVELADWLVPDAEDAYEWTAVPPVPLVGREEADTQEVYSVVVREMSGGDRAGGRVVLATETGAQKSCLGEGEVRDLDVGPETLYDYCRAGKVSKRITALPHLAASQVFLDGEDYQAMFRKKDADGWELFYGRYPNSSGYVYLSAVGFNRAGDEAFLYASTSCGWLCGEGWYVVLGKGPGGWGIKDKRMVWVS